MRSQLDTTKLALVYPRQSSGMQVKENIYSLENQMRLVDQAYADGFSADRVLVIDEDLGKSARTIENRVGMVKALNLVDQGLVGALYAEDQTRLSRDKDTVDHMIIAKRCRAAGVPLYYGGSWRDLDDWGTRVAYKVEAVIGSEMWGLHQEKMYKALKAKAAKGQSVARPPQYGYRVRKDLPKKDPNRDTLVVHEEEAAIIRSLANQLEEVGSLRKLCRAIDGARWPDGRPITFGHLQKIFSKPVFRGHYVWGDVAVENAHEAIISPAQGARIDALLAHNKVTLRKETSDGAQLVGLLWCPSCRRKLTTQPTGKNGHIGYICKSSTGGPADPVHRHFEVSAKKVDEAVLKHLWARMDSGLVDGIIAHLKAQENEATQNVDLREGTVRSLQRKVEGLSMSLASPDIPEAARKVLLLQLDQAARELDAATTAPQNAAKAKLDVGLYEQMRADSGALKLLPLTWAEEPLQWRRGWLWRFIDKVHLDTIRPGLLSLSIDFRDGETVDDFVATRFAVSDDELALAMRLWNDPERPVRGWTSWLTERMKVAGYARTPDCVRRVLSLAKAKQPVY